MFFSLVFQQYSIYLLVYDVFLNLLGERLLEANQEQQFNRSVEDLEMWLDETEAQLKSEELGKVPFCISQII